LNNMVRINYEDWEAEKSSLEVNYKK
jgi:hypothetical protein